MIFKDEKEIINGIKADSREAFEQLYYIYSSKLYSYCFNLSKSHEDAEEIVHDVFVKIWKNRDKINRDDSLSYLIFHIAKNELINLYKKNISLPLFEDYIKYNNELGHSESSSENRLEYKEFISILHKVASKLPQRQEKMLEYKLFENKPIKEIAILLGLREQTVKNNLSQIFKILRTKLNNYRY